MGSRQPKRTPYSSILPIRGGSGSAAKWRPSTVSRSPGASSAPMSCSSRTAFATEMAGGGSTALSRNSAMLVWLKPDLSSSFTCDMPTCLVALVLPSSFCCTLIIMHVEEQ